MMNLGLIVGDEKYLVDMNTGEILAGSTIAKVNEYLFRLSEDVEFTLTLIEE